MDYVERQRLAWLLKKGVYGIDHEDKVLCGLCQCRFLKESERSNGKVRLPGKLKLLWNGKSYKLRLSVLSQYPVRKWPRINHLQVCMNSCLLVPVFNNQSKFIGEFFKVFALSVLFFTIEWNTLSLWQKFQPLGTLERGTYLELTLNV